MVIINKAFRTINIIVMVISIIIKNDVMDFINH